ncbi:Wadjet anti-phage system protein JetD domain-containing protein [Steroidobacter cummioxidans]|uniref:Wadjet anti-phage system protein JetD domain-containing protein n=1 Tax=Steroidobacter cummioxidans TaxID=1803913 RepID=UPI0019D441D2|nr:Wadjet anti-phage system protein JetD domain-containing protein [Steroidobacter cummioxidans]
MTPTQHPFLERLARLLLQKAERARSTKPVRLRVDADSAPELFERTTAEEMLHLESLLLEFGACGWVALYLQPARQFQTLVDRAPTLELLDFDALAGWSGYTPRREEWSRRFVEFLREHPAVPVEPAERDSELIELPWDNLADHLARNPLMALSRLEFDDAVRALAHLERLCRHMEFLPVREASCRVFGGSSKVLDHREELLRLLGARAGQFFEAPIQLLAAVPDQFDTLLFVENLLTFEQMAAHRQAAWERTVLLFAAGFKGTARRMRTPLGGQLYWRAGSEPSSERARVIAWQRGELELPVAFFGDLDFAGMEILKNLREGCPNAVAWPVGYRVLQAALVSGQSHAPDEADKTGQRDPTISGCTYADNELLPLLRREGRFVDQEIFDVRG